VIDALNDGYRAAYLRAMEEGQTLPTSIDVLANVRRRWSGLHVTRHDVLVHCETCGLKLADAPVPPPPSRARPVVKL
jgi:hypothetical protein